MENTEETRNHLSTGSFEVSYISDPAGQSEKEHEYLAAREKEQRILTDVEVRLLPFTTSNVHNAEWQVRTKSFNRLLRVIKEVKSVKRILDVGCGNGWLVGRLSTRYPKASITGLDVNTPELVQANRLFASSTVQFIYGEFTSDAFRNLGTFDVIVFNASIHYFSNTKEVLEVGKALLNKGGMLVVNDSQVYATQMEVEQAADRTLAYYTQLGFPKMALYYFHLLKGDLTDAGLKEHRSFGDLFSGNKKSLFPLYIFKKD